MAICTKLFTIEVTEAPPVGLPSYLTGSPTPSLLNEGAYSSTFTPTQTQTVIARMVGLSVYGRGSIIMRDGPDATSPEIATEAINDSSPWLGATFDLSTYGAMHITDGTRVLRFDYSGGPGHIGSYILAPSSITTSWRFHWYQGNLQADGAAVAAIQALLPTFDGLFTPVAFAEGKNWVGNTGMATVQHITGSWSFDFFVGGPGWFNYTKSDGIDSPLGVYGANTPGAPIASVTFS